MDITERTVDAKILAYVLAVKQWQNAHGVESVVEDPLAGRWALSGGTMMEFDSGVFRWYRHSDDLTGDCRSGSYSLTPGVLLGKSFILDRGGESTTCFSVFLTYVHDRLDGVDRHVDFPGLLSVGQMGSPDSIGIYNHRTDGRYQATRIAA